MAVKILITLEGAEQIHTSLDDLTKKGEAFMQTFQGLGQGATPLENASVQIQNVAENAGKGFDQATEATHAFTEGIRILIPIMRLAGVEVANFSGFSRVATIGLTGLATAITGAIIVALANLEENAARTRASLDSLFGSKTAGGAAFDSLKQAASDLDTTVGALAPALDSLTRAWQHFVQSTQQFKFVAISPENVPVGAVKDLVGITETFIKLIRTGGADEATATKQAKAFFDTLAEGGKVTADALKPLDNRTVQLFAEAMGRGKISAEQFRAEVGLAPVAMNRFVDALTRFRPQADQAFETDAVKSFKDELQGLLNDIQKASTQKFGVSIDQGLINFIRELRKEVPATANDFKSIAGAIAPLLKVLADLRQIQERPITPANVGAFQLQLPKDIFKGVPEQAQKAADDSSNIFRRFFQANLAGQTPLAKSVWEFLDSLPSHVQVALVFLPKMFDEAFGNISSVVKSAWSNIVAVFTSDIAGRIGATIAGVGPAIADIWKSIAEDAVKSWEQISSVISAAWNRVKALFDSDKITAALTAIPDALSSIWETLSQDAKAVWETVTGAAQAAKDGIVAIFTTPIDLTGLFSGFQSALDALVSAAQSTYNAIASIFSTPVVVQLQTSGGTGGPLLSGFAPGGLVRGAGTQTSDSILAWLSNNEFIQPAKAVQFYGLDFMEAVRKMQLPRNFFEGFNMGGLVREMVGSIPKFAQGGQAQLTPITLVIDRQRFNMTATGDTVKALNRYAVSTQMTSGGRKPSWVR